MKRAILIILAVILLTASTRSIADAVPSLEKGVYSDTAESWAVDYIKEITLKGYMNGYEDKTFHPDKGITVTEACIVLTRIEKERFRSLKDYKINTSMDYVYFLESMKILSRTEFSSYSRAITREELAKLFVRAYGYERGQADPIFLDHNLITMDKRGYVNRLRELGVVQGYENKFYPLSNVTRAEFCVMISKISKLADTGMLPVSLDNIQITNDIRDIPILTYHSITDDVDFANDNAMYVTMDKLTDDLNKIILRGYTPIFAKDINKPLPEKPIIISFDDGYTTNYDYVYPLIKKMNVKITIFLNGFVRDISELYYNKISWAQGREMVDSGVIDIQSHSFNLHHIASDNIASIIRRDDESDADYTSRVSSDCLTMNYMFEQNLGYTPSVFAYPYGQFDDASETILKQYYTATVTTEETTANTGNGLYLLPRFTVRQYTNLDDFI